MTLHEEIAEMLLEIYEEGLRAAKSNRHDVADEIIAKVQAKTIERVLAAVEKERIAELSSPQPDYDGYLNGTLDNFKIYDLAHVVVQEEDTGEGGQDQGGFVLDFSWIWDGMVWLGNALMSVCFILIVFGAIAGMFSKAVGAGWTPSKVSKKKTTYSWGRNKDTGQKELKKD